MVEILWHSQTKGRETANTNLNLNRRASSRPYLMGLGSGNGPWLPDFIYRGTVKFTHGKLTGFIKFVLSIVLVV